MGIKKRRFLIRWKRFEKRHQQKVNSKNVREICTFFFTHVRQTCFAYNFFGAFFNNFFNGFETSVKFCVFLHLFSICQKIFFLGHNGTFFKLWSQTRKKRLKKSKNVFSKCVLDFNFAPIKGSSFSKTKSNSLYPNEHLVPDGSNFIMFR